MVFLLMFNKAHTEEDEIRFSLFKFKLPCLPRPAWNFQYVLRKLEKGKEYGFKARLVWKKFVSPEDCLKEYETWASSMQGEMRTTEKLPIKPIRRYAPGGDRQGCRHITDS